MQLRLWSGEGHVLTSAEAELGPTSVAIAKDESPFKPVSPAGGGRRTDWGSSPQVLGKCRFVEMVFSPVSRTSVCWKKKSGLQDEVSHRHMREICSAQSSSSLAGRILSQESQCPCRCF